MNDIKISLESAKKMDDAFINYSGVTILGNQDSIYYFSLFLDNDFFALIEKNSNDYLNWYINEKEGLLSFHYNKYLDDLKTENIKKYIGLSLLRGF